MQKTNSKGFTLIELLVVIAIIGLLSTLAVVALNSARQKSRDSKRVADVKQMQTALELYYADKNGYPVVSAAQILGVTPNLTLSSGNWAATATGTTYMGLVPKAPTPEDNGCSATAGGNPYTYTSVTSAGVDDFVTTPAANYKLTFCLGGAVGDLGSGVRTASPSGIQ
ncbi:MAG: hypothetical protein RLZZ324_229 [Candidatus Parcubacteria bacterium]|jgi:general secretion pathway protein G